MLVHSLEKKLNYTFNNTKLLIRALTHRSYSAIHNERLEFLGDSLINCIITIMLYKHFFNLDEGNLSRIRANLVKQETLYKHAQNLFLADNLFLGIGELRSGGIHRSSILANAFEAVIGAVFLDGGFEITQIVLNQLYLPLINQINVNCNKDAKTLLQEYLQGRQMSLPIYTLLSDNSNNQNFEVDCTLYELRITMKGKGQNRRSAEQDAATKLLKYLIPTRSQSDVFKLCEA